MRYFRVRGFEKLQHYKNREDMATPSWIKLYRKKLHDFTFRQLPDATKAHVILIELLASQSGNKLPWDPKQIQSAIGADKPVDLTLILSRGFIEIVSEDSSDDAGLSSRGSLESDSRLPLERSSSSSASTSSESDPAPRSRKKPLVSWPADFELNAEMRRFAIDRGIDPEEEFENFRIQAGKKSYLYADWALAWKGWIKKAPEFGGGAKLAATARPVVYCPYEKKVCTLQGCERNGRCRANDQPVTIVEAATAQQRNGRNPSVINTNHVHARAQNEG